MGTLRVTNIEAKSDSSSPSVHEKVSIRNSNEQVIFEVDGKNSPGVGTVFVGSGIVTATTFTGNVTSSGNSTFGGSVGIGTDNSQRNLHVQGTGVQALIKSTNNNYVLELIGNNHAHSVFLGCNNSNDFLLANESNDGTFAERLRLKSNGNLGIGTNNPFGKLQVHAGVDANFSFSTGAGESSLEIINDAGSANVPLNVRASEYKIKIQGTEKLRIASGGNVGIGSTIPRAALDVPGGAATRLLLADNVTASGTEDDVTGIPAWATRITVLFNSLSQSGSNNYLIQLGTSASFLTSNYDSASSNSAHSSTAKSQNGFVIINTNASHETSGIMTIEKVSDSVYVEQHNMCIVDNTQSRLGAGICRSISAAITRLRITNTGSGATQDNGTFSVYCE